MTWRSFNGETSLEIHQGDALTVLRSMPAESVHCCVTSPPYWGLRDYGVDGQIGLEDTPEAYVARLVEVFREVRRVLRDDGTLWLNLGDSYNSIGGTVGGAKYADNNGQRAKQADRKNTADGLKPKDLCGIPWRVAFALQADGWWLRSDIIWSKPNPMPESVTDRPTKAHEYIFLLAKSERYYYDAEAVREESTGGTKGAAASFKREASKRGVTICPNSPTPTHRADREDVRYEGNARNRRTVWTIATRPYADAHFAVFPPALVEPCIKAGCPAGGIVLDPFLGSGTTLLVAQRLGRSGVGIELNADYCRLAENRLAEHKQMRIALEVTE